MHVSYYMIVHVFLFVLLQLEMIRFPLLGFFVFGMGYLGESKLLERVLYILLHVYIKFSFG